MAKKPTKMPKWKIAAAMVICLLAAVASFVLSNLAGGDTVAGPTSDSSTQAQASAGNILLMFGAFFSILTILGGVWLGYRIYQSRIPPWERNQKQRRR